MSTIIKNTFLFIAGFLVAIFIIKSPSVKLSGSNLSKEIAEISELKPVSKTALFNHEKINKLNGRPEVQNLKNTYNVAFNTATRSGLDNPERPQVNEDQVPTAPPTGRTDENSENADEQAKNEEKDNETKATAESSYANDNNKKYKYYDDEESLSSTSPIVGAITNVANNTIVKDNSTDKSNSNTTSASGGFSYGSNTKNTSNEIPDTFTSTGLQTAKSMLSQGTLTEDEYLDYLSLGLNQSNSELTNLALNATVQQKTPAGFMILTQYANSSNANIDNIDKMIAANYKTGSDLQFLARMIADDSSVERQTWAVHSLDVIIDAKLMDFNNQQIRDILVKNVSPSLNKLDANHPSYGLAQSISEDINVIFS